VDKVWVRFTRRPMAKRRWRAAMRTQLWDENAIPPGNVPEINEEERYNAYERHVLRSPPRSEPPDVPVVARPRVPHSATKRNEDRQG